MLVLPVALFGFNLPCHYRNSSDEGMNHKAQQGTKHHTHLEVFQMLKIYEQVYLFNTDEVTDVGSRTGKLFACFPGSPLAPLTHFENG